MLFSNPSTEQRAHHQWTFSLSLALSSLSMATSGLPLREDHSPGKTCPYQKFLGDIFILCLLQECRNTIYWPSTIISRNRLSLDSSLL